MNIENLKSKYMSAIHGEVGQYTNLQELIPMIDRRVTNFLDEFEHGNIDSVQLARRLEGLSLDVSKLARETLMRKTTRLSPVMQAFFSDVSNSIKSVMKSANDELIMGARKEERENPNKDNQDKKVEPWSIGITEDIKKSVAEIGKQETPKPKEEPGKQQKKLLDDYIIY